MYDIQKKKNEEYERKIRRMLKEDLPPFMKGFDAFMKESLSPSTRYSYLFSLAQYLSYLRQRDEETNSMKAIIKTSAADIDEFLWNIVTQSRLDGSDKDASPLYRNRIIAAFRCFFTHLNNSGFSVPSPVPDINSRKKVVKTPSSLMQRDIDTLVSGMRANDKFRIKKEGMEPVIVDAPESVRIKRERALTRNIAIIYLLADSHLTVSELASLDTDAIKENNVITKSGTHSLTVRAAAALQEYLECGEFPSSVLERQQDKEAFLDFCKSHMTDPTPSKKAIREFGNDSEEFLSDIRRGCAFIRKSGRSSYFPHPYDKAVFLSNRSRRLSIRMIEQMVLDMTKTYLPDLAKHGNIGPEALRAISNQSGKCPID